MRWLKHCVRPAGRWLAVLALGFHIAWLPVHLLTVAHCDASPAHNHAQALADHHGHDHAGPDAHGHEGDPDHHHYASDHESKFLAKRHALLFAPTLVLWQATELTPPVTGERALPVNADPSPPPADYSAPSGPRAPPAA